MTGNKLANTLIAMTLMAAAGVLAGYQLRGYPTAGGGDTAVVVATSIQAESNAAQPIPDWALDDMARLALQKVRECLGALDAQMYPRWPARLPTSDFRIRTALPDARWLHSIDVGEDWHHLYLKKAVEAEAAIRVSEGRRTFAVEVEIPAYTRLHALPGELSLPVRNFGHPERKLGLISPPVRREYVSYFALPICHALEECYFEKLALYDLEVNLRLVLVWNEAGFLDENGDPLPPSGRMPLPGGLWTGRIPASVARCVDWRTIGPCQFAKLIEYEV